VTAALRVMVTAGGAGIGRAVAEAFAAGGARVHVCDVDAAALAATAGGPESMVATRVDVTDEEAIDAWFDEALADLGGLDVLVNNAGTSGPTAAVEDIAFADWRRCLGVCLDSQFLCARRAAPVMKGQRSGAIINLSSTAGLFGYGHRTPYAAAKWAVIGLTKSLAVELGPFGVRVNAICPGPVEGDRMGRVIEAEAALRGATPAAVRDEYTRGSSIARFVAPSEIADACLFLASPAAKMISGQALAVDGHTETFHLS
jgi:NAD(P)-dependent dehydrogenase (short-subunit alcohol dehydrogenase family)